MPAVTDLIASWNRPAISKQHLLPNTTFRVEPEDYSTHGIIGAHTKPPNHILFDADHTAYGILLRGPKNGRPIDAAVLGFNISSGVADCLEIHGGRGMYAPLTPVRWDAALLENLIALAQEAQLDAVQVLPAARIPGVDKNNHHRLLKRYDNNAQSRGCMYSQAAKRYVLEF